MTEGTEAKVFEDVLPNGEATDANMSMVVEKYAPLVKRIAHHLLLRMPASVQVDDLVQSGMIGLLEAAKKYDVSKGASFETYAGIRIRARCSTKCEKEIGRRALCIANRERSLKRLRPSKPAPEKTQRSISPKKWISTSTRITRFCKMSGSRLFSFDDIMEGDDSAIELAVGDLPVPVMACSAQPSKSTLLALSIICHHGKNSF